MALRFPSAMLRDVLAFLLPSDLDRLSLVSKLYRDMVTKHFPFDTIDKILIMTGRRQFEIELMNSTNGSIGVRPISFAQLLAFAESKMVRIGLVYLDISDEE